MTTRSSSADFHSHASKINLLESKMDFVLDQFPLTGGSEPGTPPDLTTLTAAVNRLYNLTVRGSETTSTYPLTYASGYDMDGDTAAGGAAHYASVISLTYGSYFMSSDVATNGRNLKNVSLYDQIFGSATPRYPFNAPASPKSFAGLVFASAQQAGWVKSKGSLVGITLGSIDPSDTTNASLMLTNWNSMWRACFYSTLLSYENDTVAHTKSLLRRIQDLEAKVADHESRIHWLETH